MVDIAGSCDYSFDCGGSISVKCKNHTCICNKGDDFDKITCKRKSSLLSYIIFFILDHQFVSNRHGQKCTLHLSNKSMSR